MSDRDILTDPQWVAFQRQLDEQPDSHATRAVLADWLEGQGHPWAKAYRWMAWMKRYPIDKGLPRYAKGWYEDNRFSYPAPHHATLPLLSTLDRNIESEMFIGLYRLDAEVRLCELFDELPLIGKEEYADA